MSEKNTNLYSKMAQIMQSVGKIEKDGYNNFNKFDYQSIGAINTAIRSAMNSVGVIMFSECTDSEVIEMQWRCRYVFTFVDIETGQSQSFHWQQAAPIANNKGIVNDKAMGIIHSYAQKYFLIRTFLVTTKDDLALDLDGSGSNGENKSVVRDEEPQESVTEITKTVVTKMSKNNKPFITIEGCAFWTREPFRELDYDDKVVAELANVGVHNLPDSVQITYQLNEEGYKTPLRIERIKTEKVVGVAA